MGPAAITGDPLPESKNISQARGLWAEQKVIDYFSAHKLLAQRLRTPFAEVDLIFQKRTGGLLMVEVKTLTRVEFLPHRIGERQKKRLFRAALFLQSQQQQTVEVNWAYVSPNGEVLVIEDVCG